MHFSIAVASSLCLAGQAISISPLKAAQNFAESLHLRSFDVEASMGDEAYEYLMNNLEKRQGLTAPTSSSSAPSTPSVSTTPASGNAADFNLTKWNEMTAQACSSALSSLNGNAGNPSGMAACYNVPFFDNSTGVFESEVRLYNMTAPSGEWAGLQSNAISISMQYSGASVAPSRGLGMKKRDEEEAFDDLSYPPIRKRQMTMAAMATKTYVGQIHKELLVNGMTPTQFQGLLIPNISLNALSPSNAQPVSTNLSSNDASFVSGVFAKQATPATGSSASSAATPLNTALGLITFPFILPGRDFKIPLIGFAITLVWTGLFVLVVGLGTVGRIQFREQYRRNVKVAADKGVSRI